MVCNPPSVLDSRTVPSEHSCRSNELSFPFKKLGNLTAGEKKENVFLGFQGLLKIWIYFSDPIYFTIEKQLFGLEWGWEVKTVSFQAAFLVGEL